MKMKVKMLMMMMKNVSDDNVHLVMTVILWWNLSKDEIYLVMKVMIVKEVMKGDVSLVAMFCCNIANTACGFLYLSSHFCSFCSLYMYTVSNHTKHIFFEILNRQYAVWLLLPTDFFHPFSQIFSTILRCATWPHRPRIAKDNLRIQTLSGNSFFGLQVYNHKSTINLS